jgi:hypothetical protein
MAQPTQYVNFGGVDTRSNPLAMPFGRFLRLQNLVPRDDGHVELRYGYDSLTMSAVTNAAIHSIFHYRQLDGTKYLIFAQGTSVKKINLSTTTVSSPTVKGTAIASSDDWAAVFVNNRLQMSNGTDSKWTDGTNLRDTGLRALTAAEVANVIVYEGVREASSSERTAITVTPNSGGSYTATSKGGILIYAVYFDTTLNERGPATNYVGTGRYNPTANQQLDLTGIANLSSVNANWVKLLAQTDDGGYLAHFCTETSTAITNITRSTTTATVTSTSHGLSAGDVAIIAGNTEDTYNEVWAVATAPDANTVTFTLPSASGATGTGGTIKRIVKVANATTTGTIENGTVDTSIQANADRGFPASTVSSTTNGYQIYASIYNRTGGEHVGNSILVGRRIAPTSRCNIRMSGLPDLSGTDTEWEILLGRTADGAAVPSPIADLAGNWKSIASGITTALITDPSTDANREMPTRNGVPPALEMMWTTDDYVWGVPSDSATIYRSGSLIDDRAGTFTGRPEQSWAPNDIETFPTGGKITCGVEYAGQSWLFTHSDLDVFLVEAGIPQGWDPNGPWNVGCAGKRAFAKGFQSRPYWVTGDKQIATMNTAGPYIISEEYEKGLLSKIGDAYLGETELVYEFRPDIGYNRLIVNAKDSDGVPFQVYHDFKVKDALSPEGQGYGGIFEGQLASAFTLAEVRDVNDQAKVYAGGANGQIYQFSSSGTDGGEEFDGDGVLLLNGGPNRPVLKYIEWWGDSTVRWFLSQDLNTAIADLEDQGAGDTVDADDAHYNIDIGKELEHAIVKFTLSSHSTDGTLALNDPPHIPLETYGRIWMVAPAVGTPRGGR